MIISVTYIHFQFKAAIFDQRKKSPPNKVSPFLPLWGIPPTPYSYLENPACGNL